MKDDAANDRSTRLRVELILLGVAVFAGVMIAPSLWGDFYISDDLRDFHLPLRLFYQRCLEAGQSFAWCPQIFCGFYLQGEGQVGMTHPLHLALYRALPLLWAFNLEILVSYPALMAGTFLLLRRRSIPVDASLLGAFGFAFAGFAVYHFMHPNAVAVLAHLPFALLAIDLAMKAPTPVRRAWGGAALAAVTGSELLLGHPQTVFISLLIQGLYTALVWTEIRGWPRWLPTLAAAKVLGLALAAVQLLPTASVKSDSVIDERTPEYLATLSLPPRNIVLSLVPYLYSTRVYAPAEMLQPGNHPLEAAKDIYDVRVHEYGLYTGVAMPVLAAWVLLRFRRLRHRKLAFWAIGLAVLGFVLAIGGYTPLFAFTCRLPGFNLFRVPARFMLLTQVASAVLVAVAFTDLKALRNRGESVPWMRLWPMALPPLAALAIIVAARKGGESWMLTSQSSKPILALSLGLVVAASALVVAAARRRTWALTALTALIVVDLGAYSLTYLAASRRASFEELRALYPVLSQSRSERVRGLGFNNMWMLSGRGLIDGYSGLSPKRMLNPDKPSVQRVAGVHWRIEPTKTTTLPDPLPRARLVTQARVSTDPNADLDAIDPAVEALVEEPLPIEGGQPGSARVALDEPGDVTVLAEAGTRQFLVLSESFHHGWAATIDGQNARVYRAYGDFMGCLVEPGRHRVRFHFQPRSLAVGQAISLSSLGFLFAWPIAVRLRQRIKADNRPMFGPSERVDLAPADSHAQPVAHVTGPRRPVFRSDSSESGS